jgi:hypothetical protein
MHCPKRANAMDDSKIDALNGTVVIDKCGSCAGL